MRNTVHGIGTTGEILNIIFERDEKFEKGFVQIKFDVKKAKLNMLESLETSLVKEMSLN